MNNKVETLLVTGGCRSGKSGFAQDWCEVRSKNRIYLATSRPLDEEMVKRIKLHQAARGVGWRTVEEPLEVKKALLEQETEAGVVLLDCITLWLTNLIMEDLSDGDIMTRVRELAATLKDIGCSTALVTNEVGWGVVPENPLARRFRDLAGSANQMLARTVDRVVLSVAGIPLDIKGGRASGGPER